MLWVSISIRVPVSELHFQQNDIMHQFIADFILYYIKCKIAKVARLDCFGKCVFISLQYVLSSF